MLLITQPRVGTSHNEILALQIAAENLGWEVYPAETSWRLPDELIASGKVGVPYGSQLFCEAIAQQMGWKLICNSFDWLARLPSIYLNRKVEFMTFAEAKQLSEKKFIKPADDKVFPAQVYDVGELKKHENVAPDDTPTLVSDVVNFDLEYRCFVSSLAVYTWSNYVCHEHIADPKYWYMVPADMILHPNECVQNLIAQHPELGTVPSVIDIGRIPGVGWSIIETNPCWASGLYGCDPTSALLVMAKAVEKI